MPRKRTLEAVNEKRRSKKLKVRQTLAQKDSRLETFQRSESSSCLERSEIESETTTKIPQTEPTQSITIGNEDNLTQPTSTTSSQLPQFKKDIHRKRALDKLPYTYGWARLMHKDCEVKKHSLGAMNETCQYCNAKLFTSEVSHGSSLLCCHKGKINLPEIPVCEELQAVLERNDDKTQNYLDNIRQLNSALAMAVQVNAVQPPGRGPFCCQIHGQIYHIVNGLQHPAPNAPCDPEIIAMLEKLLINHNPYAQVFKFFKDCMVNPPDLQLHFTTENAFDPRSYNLPLTSEVTAVFVSDVAAPTGLLEFVVYPKLTGDVTRISYSNPHSDPMSYPLLFPCGVSGWKPSMPHVEIHRTAVRSATTPLQYYCYRLAVRGNFNLILHSGKLFQQYVVDSFLKVEASRIAYVRTHQKELQAENYKGLADFIHSDAQERGILQGISALLPSSFMGSPRYMVQSYQDAMSIVTRFGKPDIILTFSCNPHWPEITAELKPFEHVEHRSDLITRVFSLKLQSLLDDIVKKHVFGVVTAHFYAIEFKKRGLPQAHLLVMLRQTDKLTDCDQIDSLITAEIPDPDTDPALHSIVKRHMIHNPCGSVGPNMPCMVGGHCSKGFPKSFVDETNINVNGYPSYRRRNNGVNFEVEESVVDNRWIVPYNPYLALKYDAHINVEMCSSVRAVKQLFKYGYVYKSHDCASIRLKDQQEGDLDKINLYLNCRYVSPPEAMWRLHERQVFDRSHSIARLPVHLPEEQMIYLAPGADLLQPTVGQDTKLTAYFKLCQKDENAREYLYSEIPEHYTWVKDDWKPRKRHSDSIGRLYTVNPADRERYYLRVLLLHVKGATSYAHLRTVDGRVCSSFKEAAEKLLLVDSDDEWVQCLQEAAGFKKAQELRELFAVVCLFCTPKNILQLWETFHEQLTVDFRRDNNDESSRNLALNHLEEIFKQHGRHCEKVGLPKPTNCIVLDDGNKFDTEEEKQNGKKAYARLNNEQKQIAYDILRAVRNGTNQLVFIDGPSGTGKTFLYRTLCLMLRGREKVVLPVTSTRVAANSLPGARTYNSLFKLPVPIFETSVSAMKPHSKQAELIRKAVLIIWDEISMVPKHALGVVDRLLRDICNVNEPFGGKSIIFGGDFRQMLPVVRNANKSAILQENIQQSPLWRRIEKRKLTRNMRTDDEKFSEWVLQLGNGELGVEDRVSPNTIKIPKTFYCDVKEMIAKVFPTDRITSDNVKDVINSAILCPKNEDCTKINNTIVEKIVQGKRKVYYSCDSIQCDEGTDQQLYPLEFLNSLNPLNLPPHELVLKRNSIVMLIRNLNPKQGLISNARMVVTDLNEYSVTARLIGTDKTAVIPRMNLIASDPTLPFRLTRRQFPLKVAFAMTIESSQGQTLERAGLYLPNPVNTHGQLYVAFSRVANSNNIFVSITENEKQKLFNDSILTDNIVFKELL